MRPVKEITSEEENLRMVEISPGMVTTKRDSVEPEKVGTIVVMAFRIVGYDKDCDGSLMARLENVDFKGRTTGWDVNQVGMSPDCTMVISKEEMDELIE